MKELLKSAIAEANQEIFIYQLSLGYHFEFFEKEETDKGDTITYTAGIEAVSNVDEKARVVLLYNSRLISIYELECYDRESVITTIKEKLYEQVFFGMTKVLLLGYHSPLIIRQMSDKLHYMLDFIKPKELPNE